MFKNLMVLVLVLFATVVTGFFVGTKGVDSINFFNSEKLLSPIDDSLVDPNKTVKISDLFPNASNIWSIAGLKTAAGGPQTETSQNVVNSPQISGESALVLDLTSNKVLYEKNSTTRRPIASTLKIMTALVALERANPKEKFRISQNAATTGEDSMGASAGEVYTFEELLYGLLLPSGNDAAVAIAENVAGSVDKFVELMNQKAALLGANETKFTNPTGLDGDGEHYSTAADLAIIARYTYKNFALFRQIVATAYYEIPESGRHKYLYLENQTNLLTTYPGVKGIKPGYTPEAGLCLVTIADIDGHEVLAVVLGSQDRRGDMELLLDYSKKII